MTPGPVATGGLVRTGDASDRAGRPSAVGPGAPPTVRDRFVPVRGRRLHYLEWGDAEAPPLLLLHGGTAHAHWWTYFVAALGAGFRVLALDLLGHGDSEWSADPVYSIEEHAADVGAFIATMGFASLTLVGHSFGGLVSIEYAAASPERLARLVLVDTRTRLTPSGVRFMRALRAAPRRRYATQAEAVENFRLLPDGNAAAEGVLKHVAAHAFRQDADGHWVLKFDRRALGRPTARDLVSRLARIPCPILFVRGAFSDVVSAEDVRNVTAAVPRMRVVEIADAHHHVMLDRPEALADAVREFLAGGP